jgi:serine/threonine-protein kinase
MATEELLSGRYRLDRIAGHGGMATVFEAHDTVLNRTVAIKLLQRRHDATGVTEERFRREAQAEARLVHPNIVAVHDVGEHEDGRPYIVMDFVEGRTLSAEIADGPIGSERMARMGVSIARALAAAHEIGIIHRDVKPANIMIDAQGLPQLTDFGLARISDEVELTIPGELLGTAMYVAPEQARFGTCTPQGDLYSFGAVLYHALAGAPPFEGSGAIDVALRRFEEDPPPLTGVAADVDTELANLVHALLARDPEARPADASSVAETLADIAARIRTQRAAGDGAPAAAPAAVPQSAAPAHGAIHIAPNVPPPNVSMLPAGLSPTPSEDIRPAAPTA